MATPTDDDELSTLVGEASVVRRVFDEAPTPLFALSGPEQVFVATNAAFRRFLGRADVVGRRLRDALPELDGRQLFEMVDRADATGKPIAAQQWRVMVDVDATGEPVERYVDLEVRPHRSADRQVVGLVAALADVTEQVRGRRAAPAGTTALPRRSEQARDPVTALQQELLPRGVPVLPGLEIAASYLLADADSTAGGDWFDAIALPDGRVALVVGDVVGHGVAASATMGQLRVLLQDRLMRNAGVTAALHGLDGVAREVRGARAATVCVVVLDPVGGDLEYCTAGHPAPLLVSASGPRYLPPSGGGPLATGSSFPVARDRLEVGDVVLLYSDGILERPGRDLAGSTVELAQVVADTVAGRAWSGDELSAVERVCTRTVELLVRSSGRADDITLIAAQRRDPVPDLVVAAPAATEFLADLRRALRGWMRRQRVDEHDAHAVQFAVGELATNVVEHAYPDRAPGAVSVTATLTARGRLSVQVSDRGRWREPVAAADRSLGLALVTEVVDELAVQPSATGTTASVQHRLSRPTRVLDTAPGRPAPADRGADPFLVLVEPGGLPARLRVDGPVDALTAPRLERELRTATVGWSSSAVVDLTGVTQLASAGVAVLTRARQRIVDNGAVLHLLAAPGTPADQILTLVRLDHAGPDVDPAGTGPEDPTAER